MLGAPRRQADGRAFVYLLVALGVVIGGWVGWRVLLQQQAQGHWLLGRACPFGARPAGAAPPAGDESWCLRETKGGNFVKSGPYRQWYPSGKLRVQGLYLDDAKQGVWTIFAEDGTVSTQTRHPEEGTGDQVRGR